MQLIGPADPNEVIDLTLTLRRRHDCHPIEPFGDLMPHDDFVQGHGCHPNDVTCVEAFLVQYNLTITSVNEAAKQIKCSGKISDAEAAFNVHILLYLRDGSLTVRANDREPTLISEIISVLGLDTVPVDIIRHFNVNPPNTTALTVARMMQLYQWPTNSAGGQVVGIWHASSLTNHNVSDLTAYFQGTGEAFPTMINVMPPDGTINGTEANLDICVVGSAAPGATIANYYMSVANSTASAVLDSLTRMVHPEPGDPNVTVITISYGYHFDTSTAGQATDVNAPAFHNAMTSIFQDAAAFGITVLGSTGDSGSSLFGDARPMIELPAASPYCVAVGGTVVGNVTPQNTFEEYIWNQNSLGGNFEGAATGGGVSQFYPVPSYQLDNGVNPTHATSGLHGRGTPDIAGNASGASGVVIYTNGTPSTVGGTSLTSPLFAGLIARINASMGRRTGFLHPIIYAHKEVFRDITASTLGPPSNATATAPGYNAATGWDGSSGLGIPIGTALQTVVTNWTQPRQALSYADDGGTPVNLGQIADTAFAFNHPAMTQGNHTVSVFPTGQQSMNATVNFTVQAPSTPQPVQNVTASALNTSIIVRWAAPDLTLSANSPPPWTYRVNWGPTTALANVVNLSVTNYTITGLTQSTTYFFRVDTVGPTGLVRQGQGFQINTVGIAPVTQFSAFGHFPSLLLCNWTDVGANIYYLEAATSSSGPFTRLFSDSAGSPGTVPFVSQGGYLSGRGIATPDTFNGPAPTLLSLRALLGTAFLSYWVRVVADFGSGNTATSAAFGPYQLVAFNPPNSNKESLTTVLVKNLGNNQVAAQWNDIFPTTKIGGGTITYHVGRNSNAASTIYDQTFGPFTTGFGIGSTSFVTLTNVPTGSWFFSIVVDPTGDTGSVPGSGSSALNGTDSTGQNVLPLTVTGGPSPIGIDPIAAFVGSKFTVTGSLTSFTSAPTLVYNDDNGANIPIASGFVTKDTWFILDHPAMTLGAHSLKVQQLNPSVVAIQNYTVNPAYAAPAPSSFSAGNIDSSSIALGFLPPDNNQEYTYRVQVGTTGLGGPFPTTLNLVNTGVFAPSITIQPLTPSTTYYFNVAGVAPGGIVGTFAATGPYQTTAPVAPSIPQFGVDPRDFGLRFNVTQVAGTQPITYNVAWSTSSTGTFTNGTPQTTTVQSGSNLVFNTPATLTAGGSYFYRVSAQNQAGTTTSSVQGPTRTNSGNVVSLTQIGGSAAQNRAVNLLFLAEGYNSGEQTKFNTDCTTIMNDLMGTVPFNGQSSKFNFFRLNVNSLQSTFAGPDVDSYFHSTTVGNFLLSDTGLALTTGAQQLPTFTSAIVLRNVSGSAPSRDSAILGTTGTLVNLQSAGESRTNGTTTVVVPSAWVLAHELGHSILGLLDEYVDIAIAQHVYTGGEAALTYPNVTTITNRASTKWASLIAAGTPLPTFPKANCNVNSSPDFFPSDGAGHSIGTVGLYEGASFGNCGIYRAEYNCKMNVHYYNNASTGLPESIANFCGACTQAFNNRMNSL
jgi:kumamolisin